MTDNLKKKVTDFLGDNSRISEDLESYELRPQQIQMAEAICDALEKEEHLMVEAGTGVGKSLAYLVPLILHAAENDKKIVISTNTKTLQQQLCQKDLPFLKKCLGIEFNYALCVGSDNYICQRRLNSEFTYTLFDSDKQLSDVKKIIAWSSETGTGLKSDLKFIPMYDVWSKVSRDPDLCLGNACNHRNGCFYRKAKRLERMAHILITNHALFFTDLASGRKVLPDYQVALFDESHTIEDVATDYLGTEISSSRIKYILDSIYNEKTGKGILTKFIKYKHKIADIKERIKEARAASETFFKEIAGKLGVKNETRRIRQKNIVSNHLEGPLNKLGSSLKVLIENAASEEDEKLIKSYIQKCSDLRTDLSFILTMKRDDYVYWLEVMERRGGIRYSLFASPIDIAEELNKQLFDKIKPVILTSATLSSNGSFEFIKKRLGIKDCSELLLDSPFDFEKNSILYMPEKIADPAADKEAFQSEVIGCIKSLIDVTNGRTFILFTSYRMLNKAYCELKMSNKNINPLKQGDKSRYELLEEFKTDPSSVLFGTNTFWQGVDVPGRALECVIITKLPFSVPDDPITEARMEYIESKGLSSFAEYQIPQATMMLRQGFGRLIRTKSDRGVVAILDPRVRTKKYGEKFLKALPKCRHTFDINEVAAFFKNDNV
ncbi:MAG: helicase C-terminal domain-containing protein [Candidatus Omnitrophota bacterium]|nr:helicase C-terminal domain-containing protein [Candidatus Omnitrophota bacterium]